MRLVVSRGKARAGATLVALGVLLCQATAWVHTAATPHVTCIEHGESVHLAPGGEGARAAGPVLAAVPSTPAAHDHEHCGVPTQNGTAIPTLATTSTPAVFARASVPGAPAAHEADVLLRFAPKTSPPRASSV